MLQLSLLVILVVCVNVFSCGLLLKIKELGKYHLASPERTTKVCQTTL
jgi:hypothetical protein